jgi:signal transduction histidine kinase
MKKRSVFLYWGLLLVPAALIAIAGVKLLVGEQERRNQMERAAALDRARAIAQIMQITTDGVEREITDGLIAMPQENLLDNLLTWEKENPGIRNVFIWRPKTGLAYPVVGAQASSEQMRFVARYQTLFVGRTSWLPPDSGSFADLSNVTRTDDRAEKSSSAQNQAYGGRFLQKSQSRFPEPQSSQTKQAEQRLKAGWIPWFADNRLHLLAWVQRGPSDDVFGIELETVTLVSRLLEQFPREETEGIVYALMDDTGRVLHQLGNSPIQPGMKPVLEVSPGPHLPHWRVAVFPDQPRSELRSGNAFMIIAGLLLATLITAILLGGALLTRQAYAHWQDALQKSSFVSNISHELKTPLTTIRMYAELLNEGIIKDPEKKKRYLRVIVSESERLTRLVNNVLGFSRLEQGRMSYNIRDIDIMDFIRSFGQANEIRLRQSQMSLGLSISAAPTFVRADRDALEHTFLNIVDNAVKYASEGGSLEIMLSTNDSICEIRFLDHGPGIPESHRDRIFEKFQRLDDSLTAGKTGTGLGLSIARHMMRDLGGDLKYEQRRENGGCFLVTLPLVPSGNA